MRSLVLVGHNGVSPDAATRSAVRAAARIGAEIDLLLIAGDGSEKLLSQTARIPGISTLRFAVAAHYAAPSPENIAALAAAIAQDYTHLFASTASRWKSAMPRIAALLNVAQISGIVAVESPEIFVRPIYAGQFLARLRALDAIKVITVDPAAFEPEPWGTGEARLERLPALPDGGTSRMISRTTGQGSADGRPDLSSARRIVAGGRGLGAGDWPLLERLADRLDAALGATRAAIDNGLASSDMQIGQTGKTVAPDLYLAAGVSGAIQHLVGMRNSQTIVAINQDKNAPIFRIADCGLVADLADALPELLKAI